MEWDERTCLNLIGEFRKREVLWNPRNPSYYNKTRREYAWKKLSEKIGADVNEIKKKMESLKGSYRREKARIKRSVARGKGRNEAYTSRWFGFKHLHFLDDRNEVTPSDVQKLSDEGEKSSGSTRDVKFGGEENIETKQPVVKILEEQIPDERILDKIDDREFKLPKRRSMRRRRHNEDSRIAKAFGYLEKAAAKHRKDECSIYGEYIAQKLRSFEPRVRSIAQHRFNNVIFELEMTGYQQQPTQTLPLYDNSRTLLGYSDQRFEQRSSSTSCSQPPVNLSNLQQNMLCPPTPQTTDMTSSRSPTPLNQTNFPYPSPRENESPYSFNHFLQQYSDSSTDTE